jgi:predicted RNA-binding protein with PIN domain
VSEHSLEHSRRKLIDRLVNYRGYTNTNITVVFDAYMVKSTKRKIYHSHGVEIVYTKEGETADTFIERRAYELVKAEKRVRVATSDGAQQFIILSNGALRMTANELYIEICKTGDEFVSKTFEIKSEHRNVIFDYMDEKTRLQMEKIMLDDCNG